MQPLRIEGAKASEGCFLRSHLITSEVPFPALLGLPLALDLANEVGLLVLVEGLVDAGVVPEDSEGKDILVKLKT